MKKYFIFIIALFLILFMSSHSIAVEVVGEERHKSHQREEADEENLKLSGWLENGIRIVEVKASRYKFEPDPIVVKLGEKVRLVATSTDVTHGLSIPEFKVRFSIPPDKTVSIEFTADKKGTLDTRCSVYCGPGHPNMGGTLIVLER